MKAFIKIFSLTNSMFFIVVCTFIFGMPNYSEAKAKAKKITISTEAGAKIYVNGTMIGANPYEIKVPAYSTVNVKVEKVGYITEERNFVNDDSHTVPKSEFIKMEVDDAYENSFTADIANHDNDIKTNLKEDDAWKLINRIITNSFDVIQVTDKATGYMCTAWVVKNFKSATIRTRLIIKTGNSDPLVYKAKLVSEKGPAGISANQDENFKPWDRVLRTFENVIPELQSRLGK
jgi:hypothetical protein